MSVETLLRMSCNGGLGLSDRPTGRTVQEHWDRQDAREALRMPVTLGYRLFCAGRLCAFASEQDREQVRQAFQWIGGQQQAN